MSVIELNSRKTYPVIEVFTSIQGEGAFQGHPANFIRLAGCNLSCEWCDTKESHSITEDTERLTAKEIAVKVDARVPLTVITGGEPTLHNLQELVEALHGMNHKVALETNGTNEVPEPWGIDWVTCSPKPPEYKIASQPNELKYVVDDGFNPEVIQRIVPPGLIYLQVESMRMESVEKAIEIAMSDPFLRVGIQLHKYLEVE